MDQDDALVLPLLRRQAHALALHLLRGGLAVHGLAVDGDLAAVIAVHAEQGAQQLRAARAQHAGDPQDLALFQLEADVLELSGPGQVLHLHDGLVLHLQVGRTGLELHVAEHHLDDALVIQLRDILLAHKLAVPQHRHRVRDLPDLLEAVGDVDDDHPLIPQGAHHLKEALRLVVGQGAGGLVQHQHLGGEAHGLGDLHHLALPHAQAVDLLVGVDVHVHLLQQIPRHLIGLFPVDELSFFGHAAQIDVLRHSQVGNQAQLLIDRGNAVGEGVCRRGKVQLLIVQEELAGGGLNGAGEYLDQGGLSGAVLADERMHLSAVKGDGDVIQRPSARIIFHDPFRS